MNKDKIINHSSKQSILYEDLENRIKQLMLEKEELSLLNQQLLEEREQEDSLQFSWAGNLGHWYWNIKTNRVTFNPLKATTLGYDINELPEKVSYQFFTDKVHPDDYQKTMHAMLEHLYGNKPVYEVEYRIKTKEGQYKWYYDWGKITKRHSDGSPLFLAGIVFDITEQKALEIELESEIKILTCLSFTDGLTQIYNHRFLMVKLNQCIQVWEVEKKTFSIAIFDIDNFKKINDSFGHVNGDKVLQEIAKLLVNNVRVTDIVGRYGGEEFVVIYPDADLEVAMNISERVRRAIEEHQFSINQKVTVSGGVKEYTGLQQKEFIHKADIVMYYAKTNGKNRICSENDCILL